MPKNCEDCYFYDTCSEHTVCEDYYGITPDAEYEALEELVEELRTEFYSEWFQYIDEYN